MDSSLDISKLPYRKGANAVVIDSNKNILIVQKPGYKDDEWDFPGGGVEEGETYEQAVMRELNEELGTNKLRLIAESSILSRFDWSMDVILSRNEKYGELKRGQEKRQFLVEFTGLPSDLKIEESEIKKHLWVRASDLGKYLVFDGQYQNALKVIQDFSSLIGGF